MNTFTCRPLPPLLGSGAAVPRVPEESPARRSVWPRQRAAAGARMPTGVPAALVAGAMLMASASVAQAQGFSFGDIGRAAEAVNRGEAALSTGQQVLSTGRQAVDTGRQMWNNRGYAPTQPPSGPAAGVAGKDREKAAASEFPAGQRGTAGHQ